MEVDRGVFKGLKPQVAPTGQVGAEKLTMTGKNACPVTKQTKLLENCVYVDDLHMHRCKGGGHGGRGKDQGIGRKRKSSFENCPYDWGGWQTTFLGLGRDRVA